MDTRIIDSLRDFKDQLTVKERLFLGGTAAALVAAGFAIPARSSDMSHIPGSIKCEGLNDVTAGQGDTYSGLVDEFVQTNMSPSDLPHLVDGITAQSMEGMSSSFVIMPSEIFVPAKQISAGDTYQLPKTCEKVEE